MKSYICVCDEDLLAERETERRGRYEETTVGSGIGLDSPGTEPSNQYEVRQG